MQTTNPDPTKYAFTEEGIALRPRQCKCCYDLFTPVAESQILYVACGGEVVPDPLPELIKIEQPKYIKIEVKDKQKRIVPEYVRNYDCSYQKARSKMMLARRDKKEVEEAKWAIVKGLILQKYQKREPIVYDEIVFFVFGKSPKELDGRNNNIFVGN